MKTNKLKPEVFEEAAGMIAAKQVSYCCCTFDLIERIEFGPHYQLFSDLYLADSDCKGSPDSEVWWNRFLDVNLDVREARILALLLAAEWVRDLNRKQKPKTSKTK